SIADICAHTECKTPTACADAVIEYVTDFLSDLAHSASRVRSATSTALERARGRVRMNRERLTTRPRNLLTREQQRLAVHSATLRGLDPVVTMARGWSITRTAGGTIVRSTNDVKSGDTLTTRVADGTITSTVGE
ncbi:MAG: exodeoxyribonuclease large subunit, partial [Actinomycetota bacterium]